MMCITYKRIRKDEAIVEKSALGCFAAVELDSRESILINASGVEEDLHNLGTKEKHLEHSTICTIRK